MKPKHWFKFIHLFSLSIISWVISASSARMLFRVEKWFNVTPVNPTAKANAQPSFQLNLLPFAEDPLCCCFYNLSSDFLWFGYVCFGTNVSYIPSLWGSTKFLIAEFPHFVKPWWLVNLTDFYQYYRLRKSILDS